LRSQAVRATATLSSAPDAFASVILPSGFGLPPLPYLVVLLAAAVGVAGLLSSRRPPVTQGMVAALSPWMAAGGALYALYQVGAIPEAVAPLFGSPAVYVTVGILAGGVYAAVADRPSDEWAPTSAPGILGLAGAAVLLLALVAAALVAQGGGTSVPSAGPGLSLAIIIGSVIAAAAVWAPLQRLREVSATGQVGALVVFGHALDGVSTAVGYDLLGFGEQTPLSKLIIDTAAALPTAEFIGAGWLFVLVKLLLAAVVVELFDEYVREEPVEGYLLLGLITAVGLGPGAHNVVLFAVS
jgi:uncharacterized membrane protein